jgi:hypothetical protein
MKNRLVVEVHRSLVHKRTFMQRISISLKAPSLGLQKRIAIAFSQATGFRNGALPSYF